MSGQRGFFSISKKTILCSPGGGCRRTGRLGGTCCGSMGSPCCGTVENEGCSTVLTELTTFGPKFTSGMDGFAFSASTPASLSGFRMVAVADALCSDP